MRTKIISAFPGTGKTYFYRNNIDICIDSDSSDFSWIIDDDGNKIRNPEFPSNYIEHIKDNIGEYEYILVSSHKVVRDALLNNCIFFYLIYPNYTLKELYLQRYKDRGNDQNFIDLVDKNWMDWIDEITCIDNGCQKICIDNKSFNVSDFLKPSQCIDLDHRIRYE